MPLSKMQLTSQLGTDFWNDSCDPRELREAVEHGAVGATSNPVIVSQVVQGARETWIPVLDALVRERVEASEDEIAWALIERIGREAAAVLTPVYEATQGRKGFLSMQVNPKLYRSADGMVEHGRVLAAVAPNVAIKIPATGVGLEAIERLTAEGIRVNATVSFSVPQAVACAEAMERGISAAPQARPIHYVTIMVGRLDDHLRRVMERDEVTIDPGFLNWAGIAVFKKAHQMFRARGYRATLLAAAYRHHLHWTELVGEGVIESMPYKWWKQFNASSLSPTRMLEQPVEATLVSTLYERFADFRKAYDEDGMHPDEFVRFGPSVHTLQQFLAGYHQLLEIVRQRMLA